MRGNKAGERIWGWGRESAIFSRMAGEGRSEEGHSSRDWETLWKNHVDNRVGGGG